MKTNGEEKDLDGMQALDLNFNFTALCMEYRIHLRNPILVEWAGQYHSFRFNHASSLTVLSSLKALPLVRETWILPSLLLMLIIISAAESIASTTIDSKLDRLIKMVEGKLYDQHMI